MKVLRCANCGHSKRVPDHYKACCSRRCAQAWQQRRDPDGYTAQRVGAATAAGAHSAARWAEHWATRYPGVPVATVREIRRSGYHAGYHRGQRRGFENGRAASGQRRSA